MIENPLLPIRPIQLNREWFPEQCISECTFPGRNADPWLEKWQKILEFGVNRDAAIAGLLPYGAWEREDLESWDDAWLSRIVLWLACGDFSEGEEAFYLDIS